MRLLGADVLGRAACAGLLPLKKQGAIVLGLGGGNSDGAVYVLRARLILPNVWLTLLGGRCRGTFYEGAMVKGYSSNATDVALQAEIVAAGFGK